MRYIIGGLATAVIIILVHLILGAPSFVIPPRATDQTVILPKRLLILGVVCSGALLILPAIILLSHDSAALAVFFIVISLLSASPIVAYFNCRITYNKDGFTVKNFFGIKRTYTYDEITAIQGITDDVTIKVYIGRRTVRIDKLAIGKFEFLSYANRQYRKINRGKEIPTFEAADIFHGNIKNSGEFLFFFILISLLCIGAILLCITWTIPKSADDLEYATVSFVRYEVQDEDLLLYVNGTTKPYRVPAYQELLQNADKFLALCDGTFFEIGFETYDAHYGLESIIENDGTIFLTMEDIHEHKLKETQLLLLLFCGLAAAWFLFLAFWIYVGRHPDRFSDRVVGIFFKDGYVR